MNMKRLQLYIVDQLECIFPSALYILYSGYQVSRDDFIAALLYSSVPFNYLSVCLAM